MRFTGGYNVRLQGRPGAVVEALPEPDVLHLPLQSRRFDFSTVLVREGQRVGPGRVLARDGKNFSVPLLAPRAGTVRLRAAERHITLEDVTKAPEEPYHPGEEMEHVPPSVTSVGMQRYKLLALGAWQFFCDAYTGALPDPFGVPQAVIVTTAHLEPFVARGDVQISKRLAAFTRGLEHLQSLLEYQPIYLVLPDVQTRFGAEVRNALRGYAWVKLVPIRRVYPYDNYRVLARALGLRKDKEHPVWAVGTAGVLAVDRALTLSRPSTVRIISLGGPSVRTPTHLKAMPGYPLPVLLESRLSIDDCRVLNGGVMSGQAIGPQQAGLDVECEGLTVLPEHGRREFLGFMRPGLDRRSYSNCFLSLLRHRLSEPLTTALRGERRPCISCGFCEEVCPAGIMPQLIHRYLYQGEVEVAERVRLDLCVACGLCSFVCPSKIELRQQFVQTQEALQRELRTEEAH